MAGQYEWRVEVVSENQAAAEFERTLQSLDDDGFEVFGIYDGERRRIQYSHDHREHTGFVVVARRPKKRADGDSGVTT